MKKRAAPLFLAVLTACALACPALAAEAPSPEATPSVLYRAQDQQDLRTLSYG